MCNKLKINAHFLRLIPFFRKWFPDSLKKGHLRTFLEAAETKGNTQYAENKYFNVFRIFANKNLYKPIILKFQTLSDHPDYRIGLSFLRLIDNLRIAVQTNRIIDYSSFASTQIM